MPTQQYSFEPCINFELGIGESPVWDGKRGLIWFVDVIKPAVYSLNAKDNSVVAYPMPDSIGSLGLLADDRLMVALRTGIHIFEPDTGNFEFLVHPEPLMTMNRLNDGKVGPDGCFWVGSMHDSQPRMPTASLYRIRPTGEVENVLQGLKVSNGLAWSPDGKTMYHSDSRGPHVRAFDFDYETGRTSNERLLISLDEERGLPDGAAVDVEGNYWSAGVTAGVINKFSPAGALIGRIELPALAPTMPCFGGDDMKTLYVTSLTAERDGTRTLGTLLRADVDIAGVEVGRITAPDQSQRRSVAGARR
ncbi:sugar lactone lactonase YvrE [Neorhizobium galegae]|uniref:SMP-30/gluconolactonase/LRE family protein n=1 Tax=Neorhizobium galegae TaxID=399 RepID=UPI002781534F|nr:SMP-30/gluconolactonase/LRE family protein [Neorhizobium galegae]MDQ0138103.1 sugar lactone lactonase YvrE [Neorhizobium galegae]